jgi:hypothetical protein
VATVALKHAVERWGTRNTVGTSKSPEEARSRPYGVTVNFHETNWGPGHSDETEFYSGLSALPFNFVEPCLSNYPKMG